MTAMTVLETRAQCRERLETARAAGRVVGLVPTMGALHDGHVSLITRARDECDVVAVSIFVNPLQFGDPDDIAHYPRTLERDLLVCAEAGADVVFVPPVSEMYPSWPERPASTVTVRGVSEFWEGASRPGHFDGVATVVTKLFATAGPCRAYFGLKDFQQLAVVRRLALDLSLPVEVIGCPIVREVDGLALSSRNVRLGAAERVAATVLARALAAGRAAVDAGERSGAVLGARMAEVVGSEPLVALDYAVAVDVASLVESETVRDPQRTRLLIAATVGPVRLIDNSAAMSVAAEHERAPVAGVAPSAAVPSADLRQSAQLERIG